MSDPYSILGLDKTASQAEIKKAYKKLAVQYHPDKTGNDVEATDKFKKIADAYEKISTAEKRKQYDMFGDRPPRPNFRPQQQYSFFGDMDSIFDDFFSQRKKRVQGENVQVSVKCTLEEVLDGCEKKIEYFKRDLCCECNGAGAKAKRTCDVCHGQKYVAQQNNFIVVHTTCTRCGGKGEIVEEACPKCTGSGLADKKKKELYVKIPAGIEDGTRLAYRGEGNPAPGDGLPGNLFVFIEIEQHEFFRRDGYNLYCKVPITYTQLILGAKIKLVTLDGCKGEFSVPSGSSASDVFKIGGKGLPIAGTNRFGDVVISLDVDIPDKMDDEYKEIIIRLSTMEDTYITDKRAKYGKYLVEKERS